MRFVKYLRNSGYRLFRGTVDSSVYATFGCPSPRKAVWYFKEGSYQCAGCKRQCETDSPVGFQIFLYLK
ncbi:MAG: DNA-binding protein [Desulfovibrio sp.]|uniref:DNA-binding protein n=1 Tax=Desulfovibrio sp. 7SRBS1 TaxID=3378064 RepID=UPI003B3D9C27